MFLLVLVDPNQTFVPFCCYILFNKMFGRTLFYALSSQVNRLLFTCGTKIIPKNYDTLRYEYISLLYLTVSFKLRYRYSHEITVNY